MSVDILQAKIRKLKNPTMVGLDPTQDMIPQHILDDATAAHGNTLEALAAAYGTFCKGILDAMQGLVPAVKVQSACFYALGASGVAVLQELLAYAGQKGFYVLLDLMREDVGHIAEISAASLFGGITVGEQTYQPYLCDGITINGYLGSDGIKPFLPYCREQGKNLVLVVKTSNKSSLEVQDLLSGDRVVHTAMADLAMRWSSDLFGKNVYSELMISVGATYPEILRWMREKYDRLFLAVPGYGAQGGTARNVQYAFDQFGHGAIISASRSITAAWKKAETDGKDYQQQAVAAAEKMKNDISKFVVIM